MVGALTIVYGVFGDVFWRRTCFGFEEGRNLGHSVVESLAGHGEGEVGALLPLLLRLEQIALQRTPDDDPGHDAAHVRRVTSSAVRIAHEEHAELGVVVPAALLHELFNYPKNHADSARSGQVCAELARCVLEEISYPAELAEAAAYAIAVHPFSLGVHPETLEARVLQDADRLDALGAIGIARCFSTGARMGSRFYSPVDPFCAVRSPDDKAFTVDHFAKKLFALPEAFHTSAARRLGHERCAFMRTYLEVLRGEISA